MKRPAIVARALSVTPCGVRLYAVASDHSRHIVDLAARRCGCAGFRFRGKCRHVTAAEAYAEACAQPETA